MTSDASFDGRKKKQVAPKLFLQKVRRVVGSWRRKRKADRKLFPQKVRKVVASW
ncbi:hypothetical protein HMPREF1981_00287 [Bacteroides pyogenes F0041]|uniref:Uncharacterized protein n=1 Tax=Bacteroides pyogenes F0041 TaxID=1321819 RepID=U2CW94_9BACE|nr:hypothetical protein HMPREF1981_00287 [Bacteroides pyogenes F0041]